VGKILKEEGLTKKTRERRVGGIGVANVKKGNDVRTEPLSNSH
jgi:hypothetical protein